MSAQSVERILVVEDDPVFGEVLCASFKRRGLAAAHALDLEAALRSLVSVDPTHAVIDLRLGEESGLEVVAAVLARRPRLQAVVLTGYASIATAIEAIKLGAVHYLTKPATADDILAAFERRQPDLSVAVPAEPLPLERLEWEYIQRTLTDCAGNISAASRRLGLHRRTLQRKLSKRPSGLG